MKINKGWGKGGVIFTSEHFVCGAPLINAMGKKLMASLISGSLFLFTIIEKRAQSLTLYLTTVKV